MTKKKNKQRLEDSLSEAINPKPKIDRLNTVHSLLGNYRSEPKPAAVEMTNNPPQVDQTQPDQTKDNQRQPNPTKVNQSSIQQKTQVETSPVKNYTKVPNSIAKEAIPQKLFKGLSKHTYDVLYLHTRGAINPTRKIQMTKRELMKLTGLADNTVTIHIRYLKEAGLISTDELRGKHEGSIYEVFVPEELDSTQPNPTKVDQTRDNSTQNLVPVQPQNFGLVGSSNLIENKDSSGFSKTNFKTIEKTSDDEFALKGFVNRLEELSRKYTGKSLSIKDKEKWEELADLLVLEFEIAASRTQSVSNVPAFLTEHLKRRLYSKSRTAKRELHPAHLDVGKGSEVKSEEELTWQPQTPLTDEQRQNTLNALKEAKEANNIFFREFKAYGEIEYTAEDFNWLMQNLEMGS